MNLIKKIFSSKTNLKNETLKFPISAQPNGVLYDQGVLTANREYKFLASYLDQLEEEGYVEKAPGSFLLNWDAVYSLLESEEHKSSLSLLNLPEIDSTITPSIISNNSLADPTFKVVIKGWSHHGQQFPSSNRVGALFNLDGQVNLLSRAAYQTAIKIRELSAEQQINPGEVTNQKYFADIRKLAIEAGAELDGFIDKTIVLKPENIDIKFRKSESMNAAVIEVSPAFDNQPESWLDSFDKHKEVQDKYTIANRDGSLTHLIVEPEVKSVLKTIKTMPGRRVAGNNALKFLKNPIAFIGDDASKVIDEEKYQSELEKAGIIFYRFELTPELDDRGKVKMIHMSLIPKTSLAKERIEYIFEQPNIFSSFIDEVSDKFNQEIPCCFWNGVEIELSDLSRNELEGLSQLSARWQAESKGKVFDDVFDLSLYGERIKGIGVADRLVSPYLKKENSESWVSEQMAVNLNELGFDVALLSKWENESYESFLAFKTNIEEAKLSGEETVTIPGIELEVPLAKADMVAEVWGRKYQEKDQPVVGEERFQKARSVLLLEDNVEALNFIDERAEILSLENASPELPKSLKPEIQLKQHQQYGVAWLQNLFQMAPSHVTGCLLADDMGLGKTIQLLTFIVNYLEKSTDPKPCLVVAPVSLLDNWQNELEKFFDSSNLKTLKLYGKTLSDSKYPKNQIPADLVNKGIQNLLKHNWLGDAKIVFTTYETMRDQQFSLAQQPWGVMVCDEAQKIKTPGTLVTDAAWAVASRSDFRVACTGTPVENTLVDLWCLFEFFQAGFLGPLNEFAVNFKKPIECKTEADEFAIKRLRQLIEPQILRRLKSDVVKDLPLKLEDNHCRHLGISQYQHKKYREAIEQYEHNKKISQEMGAPAGTMILGLLHKLKMICAHPIEVTLEESFFNASPKMDWLRSKLCEIKSKGEKAIVFSELRDIQRDIKFMVSEQLGYLPKIINGDTNSNSEKGPSRQKLIDEFQAEPGFGVIILSTTAVGFGVNVQAANHVIHFTRPWNPAKEDQATDRAYRIGQTKDVFVYYPTIVSAEYETFEKTLDSLLTRKRMLAGDMLNGYDEIDLSQFDL